MTAARMLGTDLHDILVLYQAIEILFSSSKVQGKHIEVAKHCVQSMASCRMGKPAMPAKPCAFSSFCSVERGSECNLLASKLEDQSAPYTITDSKQCAVANNSNFC